MSRLVERAVVCMWNGFRRLSKPEVGLVCARLDGTATMEITMVDGFKVHYKFLTIDGNATPYSYEYIADWVHAEHSWLKRL